MWTKERWDFLLAWLPHALSAIALLVAALTWWASWSGSQAAWKEAEASQQGFEASLKRDAEERRKAREETWQATAVYRIIENGSKKDERGVELKDILLKYQTEGLVAEGIDLKKEQFQEPELRRVLLSLLGAR